MSLQDPPQQPPASLQCKRDHKHGLWEAEVRGRTNGAVMLGPRTKLHELPTVTIAAEIVRAEQSCAAFHARTQTELIEQPYTWEAKEANRFRSTHALAELGLAEHHKLFIEVFPDASLRHLFLAAGCWGITKKLVKNKLFHTKAFAPKAGDIADCLRHLSCALPRIRAFGARGHPSFRTLIRSRVDAHAVSAFDAA